MVRQDVVQSVAGSSTPPSKVASPAASPPTSFSTLAVNAPGGEREQQQYLAQVWKKSVYETVARMACDNFLDGTVVSSCLFFFDQCEIDSLKLKVDLAVAKRIYAFREASNPKNRDLHAKNVVGLLYQLLNLKPHPRATAATSAPSPTPATGESKKGFLEIESLPHRVKDDHPHRRRRRSQRCFHHDRHYYIVGCCKVVGPGSEVLQGA